MCQNSHMNCNLTLQCTTALDGSRYHYFLLLAVTATLQMNHLLLFVSEYTKKPLDHYISKLNKHPQVRNKIKIIRNKQRDGLVRSRLRGASASNGEVLTFLDSHCEATKGWIEPLLQRIKEDNQNVVCPVIEVIDAVDFSYKGSTLKAVTQIGSFTWDLFFTWKELSPEQRKIRTDMTEPLK